MNRKKSLPAQFQELEEFLDWALPSETQRRQKRESSSIEEIQEFYYAILHKVRDVIDYFRAAEAVSGGADKVDNKTRQLFALMLAFADASLSIELHKSPTVPDGMPGDIWKPEHETVGWQKKPKIRLFPKDQSSA